MGLLAAILQAQFSAAQLIAELGEDLLLRFRPVPLLDEYDVYEQLMDYCKEQLTAYKKPKYIEFRTDLPKTPVGKILRRELRDKK